MPGVHPPERKITSDKPIERAPLPKKVIIPLQQHIGAPCEPLVKEGDRVRTGQKIGDAQAKVSAPVHASITGTVTKISQELSPSGTLVNSVTIEGDGTDDWCLLPRLNPDESKQILLERVREAGIVGMGGAGFPTHIKLNPPKPVKVLIVNGVECEPYITCDDRLMVEFPYEIAEGARIAAHVLGVEEVFVAIEKNKPRAVEKMKRACEGFAKLVVLKTRYPRGDERHLIKSILGVEVPAGGLPFDVGVVVHNVATLKAVRDAVVEGRPLVQRVVTVTGDVPNPKNLLVRIGTPISELLSLCNGGSDFKKLIAGGPMMGVALPSDAPITKTTGNILVVKKVKLEEEGPCIRCGRCVEVCPMGLVPTLLAKLVRAGRYEECLSYNILSCDECGCCAYICPSRIPLVHIIRTGKTRVPVKK